MECALAVTEPKRFSGLGEARDRRHELLCREEDLRLERLFSPAERDQAFLLRHRLFAETLHWVPEHPSGREVDEYDGCTEMIGILDGRRRLLGQVRMHPCSAPFMIEREFASVLGRSPIPCKDRDTAEATRFGLEPDARARLVRTDYGRFDLFTLLLKGIYRWCQVQGARTLFAVVDTRMFRLVRVRGFPFAALAEPRSMPDGVVAVAIRLDWEQFLDENRRRRPGLLAWFEQETGGSRPLAFGLREVPAGPISVPWPQPEAGSLHPVSA
jgi:N-acyl-L-homoserine lactone synthetase